MGKRLSGFLAEYRKSLPVTADSSGNVVAVGAAHPEANTSPSEMGVGGTDARTSVVNPVRKTVVSADTLVTADPAYVYGIFVNATGTSINLYDHDLSATGESLDFKTNTTGAQTLGGLGVEFDMGIYADITGGEVVVLWRPI